jgi:hypothetical protein
MRDDLLIKRIRGGETELFEELIHPYLPGIFARTRSRERPRRCGRYSAGIRASRIFKSGSVAVGPCAPCMAVPDCGQSGSHAPAA